jgi:hypothetical protein
VTDYFISELKLRPAAHEWPDRYDDRKIAAARALGKIGNDAAIRALQRTLEEEKSFRVLAATARELRKFNFQPEIRARLAACVLLAPLLDARRCLSVSRQLRRLKKLESMGETAFVALHSAIGCYDVTAESKVRVVGYLLIASGRADAVNGLESIWDMVREDQQLSDEFSRMLRSPAIAQIIQDPMLQYLGS